MSACSIMTGPGAGTIAACLFFLPMTSGQTACADTIYVPGDYPTIQQAIDACSDGDKVVVSDGNYTGPGNVNLDFDGRLITVRSASGDPNLCIIDCEGNGRGFVFTSRETAEAVVEGLTITAGFADEGGGLFISDASPTIRDCIISNCFGDLHGGGVYINGGLPSFTNCAFLGNITPGEGGGVYGYEGGASPIIGCVFEENEAWGLGGALYSVVDWDVLISQTTFTDNGYGNHGGAVYHGYATLTLDGCTFVGNYVAPAPPSSGGAVYVDGAWLNVANSTFTSNFAREGGAIVANAAILDIADTQFTTNYVYERGGALELIGSIAVLAGCTFLSNMSSASGDGGGAIYHASGDLITTECAFESNMAWRFGGALCNTDGEADVIHCTLTDNFTLTDTDGTDAGGAIANLTDGILTVTGGSFSGNDSADAGGAIANAFNSTLTITGCTLFSNSAAVSGGGGLFNGQSSTADVNDCTFIGNLAFNGGGGAVFGDLGTTIRSSDFMDNSAPLGGAISTSSDPDRIIDNCRFFGNVASIGGAVHQHGGKIVDCVFRHNDALNDGGAVSNSYVQATIVNCAFTANTADGNGGGIHSLDSNPAVKNSTFSGNAAQLGGAMCNTLYSHPTVTNCILWGDEGGEIHDSDGSNAVVTYCDVQGGHAGEGNIDVDPLFIENPDPGPDGIWGTGDDNYGDLHLHSGSPCIDAADNTAVPDGVTTDLDGNPRFVDDPDTEDTGYGEPPIVDMGAYEYQVEESCPADFDDDGDVDTADLLYLLGAWGTPDGDVDSDGDTDTSDLLALLAAWGQCP